MAAFGPLVILIGLGFSSFGASGPADDPSQVTADIPPGWEDATVQRRSPELLAVFKGPQESSFVLTRLRGLGLSNPAARKALLLDVLSGINRGTGLAFLPKRETKTVTYKNNVTAHCLHADLDGKPRMILAIVEYRGRHMLATLRSSVPDTMLPSILGTLQAASADESKGLSRSGDSADSQLGFSLPNGLWLRAVAPREKSDGIVAVVLGLDSVLSFKKIDEASSSAGDEAALVKYVLKSAPGVDPVSISTVKSLATPAGPGILYGWAKVKTARDSTQVASGFLPWGYWGYSLWASGPRARELMETAVARLKPGPAADEKLLAATPSIARKWSLRSKILMSLGSLAGAVFAVVVLLRFLGRRRSPYVTMDQGGPLP
ncbi:MAG: hypothetical protein HY748_10895 [Elusimicrobia bacterium]|nr:hypothetical protein [Elusimicrobiota bacterium]